jgi:hypothetical protein
METGCPKILGHDGDCLDIGGTTQVYIPCRERPLCRSAKINVKSNPGHTPPMSRNIFMPSLISLADKYSQEYHKKVKIINLSRWMECI